LKKKGHDNISIFNDLRNTNEPSINPSAIPTENAQIANARFKTMNLCSDSRVSLAASFNVRIIVEISDNLAIADKYKLLLSGIDGEFYC